MNKPLINKTVQLLLIVIMYVVSHHSVTANDDLDSIYTRQQAPTGVVFEIVDWDDDYLQRAIPWVNQQIISLREKFPDLEIAVVSHGSEQFALLKDSDAAYPEIHSNAQRLITDHDITLELCLGHAGMKGFNQDDFPDYVEIEASGPSQIAAYESLGYDKVVVAIE
jgi:hypothetical protein